MLGKENHKTAESDESVRLDDLGEEPQSKLGMSREQASLPDGRSITFYSFEDSIQND